MDSRVEGHAGGILTVADIVAEHGHAVERDLLAMGYHVDDVGDRLDLGEFVSIVISSPPNTAVRYAVEHGWSQTDMLLANLHEQQAGLLEPLPHRYMRPGVEEADPGPVAPGNTPRYTAQTIEEFQARRKRDIARANELAATEKRLA